MSKDDAQADRNKGGGAVGLGTAQPSATGAPKGMGKVPGEGAGAEASDPTRPVNPGAPVKPKHKRG
jgi:hypothetical protein